VKIPPRILEKFGGYARGLEYGCVSLELHLRQGRPRLGIKVDESILLTEGEAAELLQEGGLPCPSGETHFAKQGADLQPGTDGRETE